MKRKLAIAAVLLMVFGCGIAAERYRRYWQANVGSVSLNCLEDEITLTLDGAERKDRNSPITLRAGTHQLRATWQAYQVETTIHVERDDPVHKNQFRCSVEDGQLRLYHGRHLLDFAPRPEPEVFAIQTAGGDFWHAEAGRIKLREFATLDQADSFTIHWIRPTRTRAFIQTESGNFVTNSHRDPELLLGTTEPSDENAPAVFEINRENDEQDWVVLKVDENVIGSDAESREARSTPYAAFGLAHRLVTITKAGTTQPPLLRQGHVIRYRLRVRPTFND